MKEARNIVLTGFMGTGKTSVGKTLAEWVTFEFSDMDAIIEKEEGKTVPEIFAEKGEAYFRQKESEVAQRLARGNKQVIATGGGTVKDPKNMEALKEAGIIVCLTASVDTILQRTAAEGERPLLDASGDDRRAAIEKLLAEREALYKEADYTINTDGKTPDDVAGEIFSRFEMDSVMLPSF